MKKISLYIILGILICSLLTYFILDFNKHLTQEAQNIFNASKLENLKYTLSTKEQEIENLLAQKMELENKNLELLKITKKELLSFSNDELGFSFSYPAWFGKLDFNISNLSDFGGRFDGSFENVDLAFGGASEDYDWGRAPSFFDFPGYTLSDNKYLYNYSEKGLTEKIYYEIIKAIKTKGDDILLLKGEGEELIPIDDLYEDNFGAYINLNNKKFHGLAFRSNKMELDEFEAILKTLVIK